MWTISWLRTLRQHASTSTLSLLAKTFNFLSEFSRYNSKQWATENEDANSLALGIRQEAIDEAVNQVAQRLPSVRLHVLELECSILGLYTVVGVCHQRELGAKGAHPTLQLHN